MATTSANRGWTVPAAHETGWSDEIIALLTDLDSNAAFLDTPQTWVGDQTFSDDVLFNGNIDCQGEVILGGVVASTLSMSGDMTFNDFSSNLTGLIYNRASMVFASINGGAQGSQVIAITGAGTDWAIIATPNDTIGANLSWTVRISSNGIATVTITNHSGSPITPATVNWTVIAFEGRNL